jgi:hypothetical protein
MAIAAARQEFGLSTSTGLAICNLQSEDIKEFCEQNTIKGNIIGSFYASNKDIVDIIAETRQKFPQAPEKLLPEIVWVAAYAKGQQNLELQKEVALQFIRSCKLLPKQLTNSCASGYAIALAKHGFPNKQYVAVSLFCKEAAAILEVNGKKCASLALTYLHGIYAPAYFKKACKLFKEELDVDCATDFPFATSTEQ